MQVSFVYAGCTCFLLFVCHRTSVCGPAGDAAAYNFAAKNSWWATNPPGEFSTISPCRYFHVLPVLSQEDTPGGFIPWKTRLAFMKWTLTLYSGRLRGRPLLQLQRPECQWPSSQWLWEACGLFSAPCSSGASSLSLRGGSLPACSPPHFSAFSTTSISWQHSIGNPAVTSGPPQLTVY